MSASVPADLSSFLLRRIAERGFITIDDFMAEALGHPEFGYYVTRDPLGAGGDFTTAPEISQMFGEMIGAWLADIWAQMGAPSSFILLELGPGRGTLMADIVRAGKAAQGFTGAARVHLIETSPALREKQREALEGYEVRWHDDLSSLPADLPILFVANEFFDALPFKQYVFEGAAWHERVIIAQDGELSFSSIPVRHDPAQGMRLPQPTEGKVLELSKAREAYLAALLARLKAQGGAGLMIDYGHLKSGYGDTFQAVRDHAFSNPLEYIGESDLTSHVDFAALARLAEKDGAQIYGMTRQGDFLLKLGIGLRAAQLSQKADTAQKEIIEKALHRLTHSDEMGSLFKVMGVGYAKHINPAGF